MHLESMGGKRLFFRTMCAVLALPIVAGQSCGDGSGRNDAIYTSCANSAAAQCDYLARCLPVFLGTQFGDVAGCMAGVRLICEGYATWPGVGWTPEKFDQCNEHIQQAACAGLRGLGGGPCANVPGTLARGTACVDGSQCVTGYCHRMGSTNDLPACGTCSEALCGPAVCKAGEGCVVSSGALRCAEIQAEGTACTSESLCETGLSCLGGVCTKSRNDGESCMSTADCNELQELTCADRICRRPSIVDIGASCSIGDRCARSGICRTGASQSLTCVAPLPNGAPCRLDRGDICTSPSICLSGACRLPAEVTCP
jgi:hypothetical protein